MGVRQFQSAGSLATAGHALEQDAGDFCALRGCGFTCLRVMTLVQTPTKRSSCGGKPSNLRPAVLLLPAPGSEHVGAASVDVAD